MKKNKIIHIINNLGSGGAENMLYKFLSYSSREKSYHEVISLTDADIYGNMYGERIEALGIKVHCLNLNYKNVLLSLLKAKRISMKFDVVNTWLYHSALFGFIVSKILLRKKLIWNIRHSNLDKDANKAGTLKVIKINSIFSKYVDLITYNSDKALDNHVKFGYMDKNSVVIPNGFDLDVFKYNKKERLKIRKKLMLGDEEKVIITVGRWEIQKDYYTLIKALAKLKKKDVKFKMLMVGTNLDSQNIELLNLIKDNNLNGDVILLGQCNNIPSLLSAADLYVSSSLGESFSNAIAEAMACELTCVATDIGNSKTIIGNTEIIVEPKNYIDLSEGLYVGLINNSQTRNTEARKRIKENYEIKKVCGIINQHYCSV